MKFKCHLYLKNKAGRSHMNPTLLSLTVSELALQVFLTEKKKINLVKYITIFKPHFWKKKKKDYLNLTNLVQ